VGDVEKITCTGFYFLVAWRPGRGNYCRVDSLSVTRNMYHEKKIFYVGPA
jgi:hypothetical protein